MKRGREFHESKASKNTALAVGYKNDRTFVVRGQHIGVFTNENGNVKHVATINEMKTSKGKLFAPKKVSTQLILLSAAY